MAFHIRDPRTDKVVRQLAARKGVSMTEAVREAVATRYLDITDFRKAA